jgi:replicative DNA helicase
MNIQAYAETVREKSVRRNMISSANSIILMASDESNETSSLEKKAEIAFKNIPTLSVDTSITMENFYENYYDRLEKHQSGESFGYKTGVKVLDNNCE